MPQAAQAREVLASLDSMRVTAEKHLAGTRSTLKEVEGQLAEKEAAVRGLAADEEQARARLDELTGRESALKAEIATLSASVREQQATLDQIRTLGARQEETARAIEAARQELAGLRAQITPLRTWKDAMDLLYARFAELPQASPEAQEVWREIESGKAKLRQYIVASQMRVPRIVHIEFSKEGLKPRLPMKSERMRGKADGKKA
jgi:chromosome segregation ATPase